MRHGRTLSCWAIATIAFCALAPEAPAAPKSKGKHDARLTIERARALMGTPCVITAEGLDSTWVSHAVDDAFGEIDRLDGVLSSWRTDSELSRVNAAGSEQRIPCSPDLFAVLDSALAIARATDGAFDPTVEPLMRAWDMRGAGHVPEPGELGEALQRVGWKMVDLVPSTHTVRFSRDGMGLDFGGIGKGYALDRALDLLRGRRVVRVLLNFGGELLGITDGEAWVLAVADPTDRLRPVLRLVLKRGAVSTSGQGERFVTADHQQYGHIVDPHLGKPLDTHATVTVVASSAARADGLSTALLVMGRDRARAFVEAHPDIGAVWLEREDQKILAWRWNLPTVSVEPGVDVEWMP